MILYSKERPSGHTIGGKAMGLYRLRETSLLIPDFIIIPAEAFDPILKIDWQAASCPEAAKKALLHYQLPEKELKQLEKLLTGWNFPASPVVVRSSVADEDGQEHAFPGMMDSFLNLRSLPDISKAIACCAASAYGERAMAYRKEKRLTPKARPAVIIQQQINPMASGVMFTTFPDYPQELAIHACYGFGEGLVGGKVDADEFYFLKKSGKLHRMHISKKRNSLQADAHKGLFESPVAKELQDIPCLNEQHLEALWQLGSKLEKALSGPQDIEFAITEQDVYLLQTRPVTQEIPEVIVYDNSNIQESYCGVTTPLTFSFASRAYATVYRQTMHALGLPKKVIQAQEEVLSQLLGLVKGRIYYNINNWYRGLQLLPSFKQNKEDMERMMGVEEPVDFVEDRKKTLPEKLCLLPGLLLNLTHLLFSFSQLSRKVAAFHTRFQTYYQQFYLQPLASLAPEELIVQKEKLDTALLQNWTTPIINDFYVMMNNGSAQRKLRKAGIQEPEEFLSRFLSGDAEIESTQPTRAMQQLATKALQDSRLQQLILALPNGLHAQIEAEFPHFYEEVMVFINRYGDRTVGELKLETATMRTQAYIFYKYLRNYLHDDSPAAAPLQDYSRLSAEAYLELERALKNRSFLFRRRVWRSLHKLRQSIRYRESLRLERTRLFGMYRSLYLQMGSTLAGQGLTHQAQDVFYLSEAEILAALKRPSASLETLVHRRRKEFEGYKQVEVPARITVPSPPVATPKEAETKEGILKGTGCYPGQATGEVIVITDPSDELDVKDKILCALRTDPGWAALFPMCRGVLIEKGSSLSHSVILLHELGIPTIINIPGLTKKLRSGERVSMDSHNGIIQLTGHEQD